VSVDNDLSRRDFARLTLAALAGLFVSVAAVIVEILFELVYDGRT